MRQPILRRSPLAFPGGRNPAFDPTHFAASNIRYSGVAAPGGALINLLNGSRSTIAGAVTGGITPIGPVSSTPLNGSTDYNTVAFTVVPQSPSLTIAAIASFPAYPTTGNALCFSSFFLARNGMLMGATGQLYFSGSGGAYGGTVNLAPNIPYFLAVSVYGTYNAYFLARNLLTGAIQTAGPIAVGGAPYAESTPWYFGGTTGGSYGGPQVAAHMRSFAALSMSELLMWAEQPFDFWWPPTAYDFMLSTLRGLPPPLPDTLATGGSRLVFM